MKLSSKISIRRIASLLLFFLFPLTLCFQTAFSGPLEDGVQAYKSRNYKSAMKILKPAAKRGDGRAQYYLGYMYKEGQGVSQSDKKAFKWFEKSATSQDKYGQYFLALTYSKGEGTEKSESSATHWYTKSADIGHRRAQEIVGFRYEVGHHAAQSYEKAVHYYGLAAKQGSSKGAEHLGELYEKGHGVPRDIKKAIALYQQAIDTETMSGVRGRQKQKMERAKSLISTVDVSGGELWLKGRNAARIQNYDKAFGFYSQAAELGHADAQERVGNAYKYDQFGVSNISYERALHWFRKAAAQNNANAQYQLAMMYRLGEGVGKSESKEMEWLKKATENGHALAKGRYRELSSKATEGQGLRAYNAGRYTEAFAIFKKAAKAGDAHAMMRLANMYEMGKGIEEDLTLAEHYYTRAGYSLPEGKSRARDVNRRIKQDIKQFESTIITKNLNEGRSAYLRKDYARAMPPLEFASRDSGEAAYYLGIMYQDGLGVGQSSDEAMKWFNKSADFGYKPAQTRIAELQYTPPNQEAQGTYSWKDQQRGLTRRINRENRCKELAAYNVQHHRAAEGYYTGRGANRQFVKCD